MTCVMGIDIGSAYSKGVIICDEEISVSYMLASGGNYTQTADRVRQELFLRSALSQRHKSRYDTISLLVQWANKGRNDSIPVGEGTRWRPALAGLCSPPPR